MRIFSFVIFLIFCWAPVSQAQALRVERFSLPEGLPDNTVRTMIQDRQGFLWLGTHAGLVRHDGYEMKVFLPVLDDSTSIGGRIINGLLLDGDGNIWVGTIDNGISRYRVETGTFDRWTAGEGSALPGRAINQIVQEPTGTILVGFMDSPHLARIDPETMEVSTIPPPPDLDFQETAGLLVDNRGWIWSAGAGTPLILRNPEGQVLRLVRDELPPSPQSFNQGRSDAQGSIWFVGENYLTRYDPGADRFTSWSPDPALSGTRRLMFTDLALDAGGSVWISSSIGLFRFHLADEHFEYFDNQSGQSDGLPDAPLFSLLLDRSGTLWIGSWHGGLAKHVPGRAQLFRVYGESAAGGLPALPAPQVRAVTVDEKGQLWVGLGTLSATGQPGGLCYLDRQNERFVTVPFPGAPVRSVTALVPMGRDSLWVGTERGLWLCDTRRRALIAAGPPAAAATERGGRIIRSLYGDSRGRLWVCRQNYGIFMREPGSGDWREFRHDPNDPHSLSQNTAPVMVEGKDGKLWVGTDIRGLNLLDPQTGRTTRFFDPVSGIVNVTDIESDEQGHLWLATIAGLLEFDPQKGRVLRAVGREQGLPNDFVGSVLRDDQGHLWLSTGWGFVDFDPATGHTRTFGLEDNLPSDGIHLSHFRAPDGTLYFGGDRGLISFHPSLIRRSDSFEPPVVLTEIRLFDTPLEVGGASPLQRNIPVARSLKLPWNRNHLTLTFAALDLTRPERVRYRFRLEGHDSHWRRPSSDRQAVYTNLPPGRFVFRAQATGDQGTWSPHEGRLEIRITPPWWRTAWAYASYVLLLAGLLLTAFRLSLGRIQRRADLRVRMLELRKLREMDKTKSRFFANISHEFRTPLTLIQGPLARLQHDPAAGDPGLFAMMHRNARRLGQLIDQLLDLSRLESRRFPLNWQPLDLLGQFRVMAAGFRPLADEQGQDLVCRIPEGSLPCLADPDLLEKVVGNLLANAIKYTPLGGTIRLDVAVGTEQDLDPERHSMRPAGVSSWRELVLQVQNTGAVIPVAEQEKIFERFYQMDGSLESSRRGSGIGLALTRELTTLLGGTIEVQSREETGTVFTVRLPLYPTSTPIPMDTAQALEEDAGLLNLTSDDLGRREREDEFSDASRPLLLVVEDDADLRAFLRDILQKEYRVLLAEGGDEGLEVAFSEVPDLIVSDLMMPGRDGFELCAELKKDERTSHIPVILLTARTEMDSRLEGLRSGADDYLGKPFEPEELRVRIGNLIEQRRLLRRRFADTVRGGVTIEFEDEDNLTSADTRFLDRVAAIARDGIEDAEFTVARFSREVGMSRSQLHRKLTALTGLSASAFLRSVRLQRAAELLEAGFGNVTEVAYATGHRNLSTFSRNFREVHGVPPSEYPPETNPEKPQ